VFRRVPENRSLASHTNVLMAEFVSGSLDTVLFWEADTLTQKKSVEPFPNSATALSSLTWNTLSILINAHFITV